MEFYSYPKRPRWEHVHVMGWTRLCRPRSLRAQFWIWDLVPNRDQELLLISTLDPSHSWTLYAIIYTSLLCLASLLLLLHWSSSTCLLNKSKQVNHSWKLLCNWLHSSYRRLMGSTVLDDFCRSEPQWPWLTFPGLWNLQFYQSYCVDPSCRLQDEISIFVLKEVSSPFPKLLFNKNQRVAWFNHYHWCIGTSIKSFQASYTSKILYCWLIWAKTIDISIAEHMNGRQEMMVCEQPISTHWTD